MSKQLTEWYDTEKAARHAGQYHLADTIHDILALLIKERHEAHVFKCEANGYLPGTLVYPDGWLV